MFTDDSTRGPSLDDTRIFRPAPHTEDVKFFREQSTDDRVQMTLDWTDLNREQTTALYLVKALEVIRGQSIFFGLFHFKSP